MRTFKMNEISGVDVPAQEGARVALMKRADAVTQTDIAKGDALVLLTSEDEGHQHSVHFRPGHGTGGQTGHSKRPDDDTYGHDHPWVVAEDGGITVGASDGHRHAVDADQLTQALMAMAAGRLAEEVAEMVGKREFGAEARRSASAAGTAMKDGSFPIATKADLKNAIQAFGRAKDKAAVAAHIGRRAAALKATDMLPTEGRLAGLLKSAGVAGDDDDVGNKEDQMTDTTQKNGHTVEQLQAQLARATKVAELTDAEKAHLGTLEGAPADEFLGKSAEERRAIVAKAAKSAEDSDPVAYTTVDGVELRKSAGAAVIALAKSNDALRKDNDELRKRQQDAEFEKRASMELKHLPGTVQERAAMLKAIDTIPDQAQRAAAHNALKANDVALSHAFKSHGTSIVPAVGSPDGELDTLAKEHAKEKGVTYEQAYGAVLKTDRGAELYAKSVN
jgi:hypothetical protein